jgi:hypothetical protein
MKIIDALPLLAALLSGGAGGWIAAMARQKMSAEQQRSYELEMADYEELYAAWASLRRAQPDDCYQRRRRD